MKPLSMRANGYGMEVEGGGVMEMDTGTGRPGDAMQVLPGRGPVGA